MTDMSLNVFSPRELPQKLILQGQYVRLEPIDCDKHSEGLFQSATLPGSDARFQWLFEMSPKTIDDIRLWIKNIQSRHDILFFAI